MSDEVKEVAEAVADLKVDKKKEKKEKKEKEAKERPAGPELVPPPAYIAQRIALFDELYAKQEAEIAAKVPQEITITLPDGKQLKGQSWRTKPIDIAQGISEGLARDTVISKVNGEVWDLDRVLEGDCKLELLKFDNDDAKAVFWHSSAHVLGEAIELHSGGCLCYGPPIEDGFYYDTYLEGGQALTEHSFKHLEDIAAKAVKEKQPFQRLVMTKEDLLKMFDYNIFKKRIINEKITTPTTTVYRCGPLIDLCRGPHIRDTSKIKAFHLTKSSATYWEGNAEAETLQRVYGISFPSKDQLKEWKKLMEEAAARDHRKIGKDQELFFFNDLSPGSCFFTPHGARIYNNLMELMRSEYRKRGFQEVVTPNIFNSKLWETSGHWQHYKDDMFSFEVEKETFALKPMNCPGHCVMFGHRVRSYKELPIRFADFGVLHRNEAAGSLTGLTRVRRFQQDDAHIFCLPSQIESEINNAIAFLTHVYGLFGFSFELNLSTRPEKFLGEIEVWDRAEAALKASLDACGHPWNLNPGDGAFYGPKIDIKIRDALKRKHQCATIQLDFQLPIRFNLEYTPAQKEEGIEYRPVIIHRAILGSVERMIAILTESFAGKWPFWLSPRQVMVIPVHNAFDDYAAEVHQILHDAGFQAAMDIDSGFTLPKKVRNAQVAQFNYILVVGEKEKETRSVAVRMRDGTQAGVKTLDELIAHLRHLSVDRVLVDPLEKGGDGKGEAAEGAAAPKDE